MSYVKIAIETNGAVLKAELYAAMEAAFPGWHPYDTNPEKRLIDALVDRLAVPLAQLISDVPDQVLEKFGQQVAAVPLIEASKATAESTWKFTTEGGVTIRAGTQVNLPTSADEAEGFVVVADVEVPAGKTETEAGEVLLEAIDAGSQANELSADPELVDSLRFFDSITIVGESAGGVDEEEPLEYLARLTETLQIQAPRPIKARDVAILLRSIASVQRVRVLDNFNHETEEDEEEKTLSAYPIDAAGEPVSKATRDACKALLEEKREANFIFFVEEPTYTVFDAKYEVVPREGYSQEAADDAVAEAITAFFDPATWGVDPNASEQTPTTWADDDTVRYQDLVTVVNNVPAVEHYTSLKFGKAGGALGVADVVMEGPAALPEAGAISVGV
jgi:Baseplate J-like protein